MSTPYDRLKSLGIELPVPPTPIANFVTHVEVNGLLFLSGQGPRRPTARCTPARSARMCRSRTPTSMRGSTGVNLLAVMHTALGDLGRVKRVVKLLGMVNAVPEFGDHPKVINGCSDLMVEVFGDAGRHARSAVGFGSLPGNITVEIEAIVAIA